MILHKLAYIHRIVNKLAVKVASARYCEVSTHLHEIQWDEFQRCCDVSKQARRCQMFVWAIKSARRQSKSDQDICVNDNAHSSIADVAQHLDKSREGIKAALIGTYLLT